jgi:hypothetical protein
MSTTRPWLVYGANGFTGQLVAEEALRRGHRPVLAGRSADKVRPLAERLGLPWAAFGLDDIPAAHAGDRGRRPRVPRGGPVRSHERGDGHGVPREAARTTSTSQGRSRCSRARWTGTTEAKRSQGVPHLRGRVRRHPDRLPREARGRPVLRRAAPGHRVRGRRRRAPAPRSRCSRCCSAGNLVRREGALVPAPIGGRSAHVPVLGPRADGRRHAVGRSGDRVQDDGHAQTSRRSWRCPPRSPAG